ncbi:MAG: hypothetical protein SGI90_08275 [Candidatus Eisenbacteria bacterium]|nr:hypothetical protein [Candidatus Eisenbacteria bacterium]
MNSFEAADGSRDVDPDLESTFDLDELLRVLMSRFTSEVTRVAREVGTDGKLGGQVEVKAWPAPGRV